MLSCACLPCLSGVGECLKLDVVGQWTTKTLKPANGRIINQQAPDDTDEPHPAHPDEPHPDEPHPDEPHPDEPHPDEPHPDEPHPAHIDEPHTKAPPSVGDFCLVAVGGRNRTVRFYAKVTEVDGEELKVTYLDKEKGNEKNYTWADSAWITANDIVKTVPAPTLLPGRGISFRFD
ncbi:hypothetical protein V1264_001343 [Littorina saxatilis]